MAGKIERQGCGSGEDFTYTLWRIRSLRVVV